jgi:hypothetical protein
LLWAAGFLLACGLFAVGGTALARKGKRRWSRGAPSRDGRGTGVLPKLGRCDDHRQTLEARRGCHQGRLTAQGRPVRGADIDLYSGRRKVGAKTTNAKGRFSFRKRIRKKTVYHAEAFFLADFTGGCQGPSIAPAGCQTATISAAAASRSVAARPRR